MNIVDKGEAIILNNNNNNTEAELLADPNSNSFIPSELMELDHQLEEFGVGSPGDGSNHLDSFPKEESMALCAAGLELLQLQRPPAPGN